MLTGYIAKLLFKQIFLDKVKSPAVGGVVYSNLAGSFADHSGIYIGDGKIVHLDGSGRIECVSADRFLLRLSGYAPALSIYTSCKGTTPAGSLKAARHAVSKIGVKRKYSLTKDNCHSFTIECFLGKKPSWPCLTTAGLKSEVSVYLGSDSWRIWDLKHDYRYLG